MPRDLRLRDAIAAVTPIGKVVTPCLIGELIREACITPVTAKGRPLEPERLPANIWAYLDDAKRRGEFYLVDRGEYKRLEMPRELEHASRITRPVRRAELKQVPGRQAKPRALDAKRQLHSATTTLDIRDHDLENLVEKIVSDKFRAKEKARILALATKAYTCLDKPSIQADLLQELMDGRLMPDLAPVVEADPPAAPIVVAIAPQPEAQHVNGLSLQPQGLQLIRRD